MTGKELAETFGTLNWKLDFYAFAKLLGLDTRHGGRGLKQWAQFQTLCRALASFDEGQLDKLIAANPRATDSAAHHGAVT